MLVMGRLAPDLACGTRGYLKFSVCDDEGEGHLGCESFRVSIGVEGEALHANGGLLVCRVNLAVRRAMKVAADRRFAALSHFLTELTVEFGTSLRLEMDGMTPSDLGTMSLCCSRFGPTKT
jgi:hypothetical protein